MILVDDPARVSLHAARGSLLVVMETGAATCSGCGEKIPKGTRAIFAWDNKRIAQPSRLHTEGVGRTTITHPCCRDVSKFQNSDTPPPAQLHSETSVAAAHSIALTTPTLRERVYVALRDAHGLTDEEGAELLAMPLNTYRPRRIELVEVGAVRDAGRTRPTHAGRQATVWEIV